MKSIICTLIIVVGLVLSSTAQDTIYHKHLYHLCKAWGHAKYYHSEIANGNVEWDYELLSAVVELKANSSNVGFNKVLNSMLDYIGETRISTGSLPSIPDSLYNSRDYSWLNNDVFSRTNKAKLGLIKERFRSQSHAKVKQAFINGNPTFKSDHLYSKGMDYPVEEQRVLALFRYWNIINYFFPYKNIMDQEWDVTLKEFIPIIVAAKDGLAYHLAFKEMTTRLNDSRSYFDSPIYNKWVGEFQPPFKTRMIEGKMIITCIQRQVNGLRLGDIILSIDGVDINYLQDSIRKYAIGSNDVMVEHMLMSNILKGPIGDFELTVSDGTNTSKLVLSRSTNQNECIQSILTSSPVWRDTLIDKCTFGLVNMMELGPNDIQKMLFDLSNSDALIFDARGVTYGHLRRFVEYLFVKSSPEISYTAPDIKFPGRLYWNKVTFAIGQSQDYKGKIILLFDERSLNESEFFCLGIGQLLNVIKIGSTTPSSMGNISSIYLPGNIITTASFLGIYYEDNMATQRIGIIPDFEVHPTIEGIRSGKDELLDFALDCDLVGAEDHFMVDEITVYPNPTIGEIYYSIEQPNGVYYDFKLFSTEGKLVQSYIGLSSQGEINISSSLNGLYFLHVINDQGHLVGIKKLIIE